VRKFLLDTLTGAQWKRCASKRSGCRVVFQTWCV